MAKPTSTTDIPRVILGAMTFGLETTSADTSACKVRGPAAVEPFLTTLAAHGHKEVDTARFYGNGDSEIVLSLLPDATAHLKISTKVFPFMAGSHNKENLPKQFRESLKALKTNKVDILYLHAPDYATPFEETINAIDDLYREGLFERVTSFFFYNSNLIRRIWFIGSFFVTISIPILLSPPQNSIVRTVKLRVLECSTDLRTLQAERIRPPKRLPRKLQPHRPLRPK